jgi:hypothetical protein
MRPAAQSVFGRRHSVAFARFIKALHVSRRIEARRLLRRYRHLISEDSSTGLMTFSRRR